MIDSTITKLELEWAKVIEDILADVKEEEIALHSNLDEISDLPFIHAIYPWIRVARNELTAQCKDLLDFLAPSALLSLENYLFRCLSTACAPSMNHEMTIAIRQGRLCGKDPRQKYLHFVSTAFLNKSSLRHFFEEYRPLARLSGLIMTFWLKQNYAILSRLSADITEINNIFNPSKSPLGRVIRLEPGLSNIYHEGASVALLEFENGTKIIYKPKNLQISKGFNDLLHEINRQQIAPPLKIPLVLPRKDYGWEEWIEHKPCNNLEEVDRYYQRTGMLLCLFYLLRGNDLLKTNIIASGEHPMVLDFEALFQPDLHEWQNRFGHNYGNIPGESVLLTGLLPSFWHTEPGKKGFDMSGLTGDENPPPELQTLQWRNVNTSTMHQELSTNTCKETQHIVYFQGNAVSAQTYLPSILKGFRTLFHFIQSNRQHLFGDEGAISRLAEYPVRCVLAPNLIYGKFIDSIYDPQWILKEEMLKNHLSFFSTNIPKPFLKAQILSHYEEKSLLQGTIPYFYCFPKRQHIYALDGTLSQFMLKESAYDKVLSSIATLGDEALREQEEAILQAFYAKTAKAHSEAPLILTQTDKVYCGFTEHNAMELSLQIAESLMSKATSFSEGVLLQWIGLEPLPTVDQVAFGPISDALYGGNCGIALFFASLAKISGLQIWKEVAKNCLKRVLHTADINGGDSLIKMYGIGGLSGAGGIAYAVGHVGRLIDEPALMKKATEILSAIDRKILQNDFQFDVNGGSAGLILASLSLHQHCQDPRLLQLATLCGERLCDHSQEMDLGGIAWKRDRPLAHIGFCHGNAGIAYALQKLAYLTKQASFSEAARQALLYERRFLSAENTLLQHDNSWCHGSIGIGFGRLGALPFCHDLKMQEEVAATIELAKNPLSETCNHHLCCGSLGRLSFLLHCAREFNDPSLKTIAAEGISDLLKRIRSPGGPGIMQGEAGLGYFLVQYLDSNQSIPQILLLE